jgi:IS30 family transposase
MRTDHFKYEERCQIEKHLKNGWSCGQIALILNRSKNGVVVEVRRSGGSETYNAVKAQQDSETRLELRNIRVANARKDYNTIKRLSLKQRMENLELQIQILHETIKELVNDN